jgi:hypothetical protein
LDEVAFRTEKISRKVCRGVSEFAFIQARRMRAKIFGGPKWTVSPVYEGMLKEEMDRAAEKNKDVRYDPQLIDATYALLLSTYGEPLVIPDPQPRRGLHVRHGLADVRLDRGCGIAPHRPRR